MGRQENCRHVWRASAWDDTLFRCRCGEAFRDYGGGAAGPPFGITDNSRAPHRDSGTCCFAQLAKGKRRLAVRLAQRWVRMQVA